jgi:hypothetical protein
MHGAGYGGGRGTQHCEPPQILSAGGENEFIVGASRAMCEPHLDLLALTS